MRDEEHHFQDALELYAVALLQGLAEARGLAITRDAAAKMQAFRAYAELREYTMADFQTGRLGRDGVSPAASAAPDAVSNRALRCEVVLRINVTARELLERQALMDTALAGMDAHARGPC